MTDNRKSGVALVAGSVGGILTMAIHPTAGGPMTVAQVNRLAIVSGVAHGLAIISVLLLFLGACGLAKSIAGADPHIVRWDCRVRAALHRCVRGRDGQRIHHPGHPQAYGSRQSRQCASVANRNRWDFPDQSSLCRDLFFTCVPRCDPLVSLGTAEWGLGRGLALYGCIISALIIAGISI